MKRIVVVFLGMLLGCGSDDACLQPKGEAITEYITLKGFHTIDIPMNVSVELIQDNDFRLEIHSYENRINSISHTIKDSVLHIENAVSCELLKSYETALLKIHTPLLKKINSRTQFKVYSQSTLTYPNLYLHTSIPNDESASSYFDLEINNNSITVEDNQVGYFNLKGKTKLLDVQLYGANGVVMANNLEAKQVKLYHRSNQNIHIKPINNLFGTIYSVGNAYVYNKPDTVNVVTKYKGNIIYK